MKVIIFILGIFTIQSAIAIEENDSLLNILDKSISEYQEYEEVKQHRINEYKEQLQRDFSVNNQSHYNSLLIKEYETYSYDSAIFYINKNVQLIPKNQIEQRNNLFLSFSLLLASTGRCYEAFDVLNEIKRDRLTAKQLENYYEINIKLNSELELYNLSNKYAHKYKIRKELFQDSLLSIISKDSEKVLAIEEAKLRDRRELKRALETNTLRLRKCDSGTRSYSLIAFERSLTHEMLDEKSLQIKFLILSAISDIQSVTKDNISLTRLARHYYEQGEINRAYRYIRYSFDDAAFYKSRLRYVQINNILPLITKAYQQKSEAHNRALSNTLIITSLLAFVLIVAITFIVLQYRKLIVARIDVEQMNHKLTNINNSLTLANHELQHLNGKLADSNLIKEQYIGDFLETCFSYIEKLDAYRKMVNKHLINKQIAQLQEKAGSNKMFDEELANFYFNFDQTFLKLFPNFVSQVNNLLVKEEQIVLKKAGTLNIELRIFALIRLGITDSATIARLLRYSINTIYNYRVKIKNKSITPRTDIEEMVMQIGL